MTQNASNLSMIVPSGASRKRDDIQLLEVGPNPAILYSIVDLGTHFNPYFNKTSRNVRLTFEFPFLMQLFNIDDTEPRATVVSMEETFQMAEKSNLKKFCDGALGRVLQPHEYERGFDISQFLGKAFMVNIVNRASKKDPNTIYNNIGSVQGVTEQVRRMYNVDWNLLVRTNDLTLFSIDPEGKCFTSDRFANLPNFLRDKIKSSEEAKAFIQRGGIFNEERKGQGQSVSRAPQGQPQQTPVQRQVQQPSVSPSAPPVPQANVPTASPKLVMIDNAFTYEQMIGAGWTDEQLVLHGKAKWVQPTPPPVPQAPQAPQAPTAPPVAPIESIQDDEEFIFGSSDEEDVPF